MTNIQNDVAPILTTASNEWTVSSTEAEAKIEGTLRWAIDQAENSGGGTITFADGLNGATIYLGATGELLIERFLTIDASNLSDGITISAASDASETYGNCRVFEIRGLGVETTKVEMIGVTITGGCCDDKVGGGGICVTNANLTLTNSRVENNCVEFYHYPHGGGIFVDGSLTLTSSTVSRNFVSGRHARGGGIYASGPVTLTNSRVENNYVKIPSRMKSQVISR